MTEHPSRERAYTEEEIGDLAEHLYDQHDVTVSDVLTRDDCAGVVEVVLERLAAAGRLLPAAAERRQEIGVRVDVAHPRRKEKPGDVMTNLHSTTALAARRFWEGWTPVKRDKTEWADGSRYEGPWVPVDEDRPVGEEGGPPVIERHKHQWALTAQRIENGVIVAEAFACETCPATKWNARPDLADAWTTIQKAAQHAQ